MIKVYEAVETAHTSEQGWYWSSWPEVIPDERWEEEFGPFDTEAEAIADSHRPAVSAESAPDAAAEAAEAATWAAAEGGEP